RKRNTEDLLTIFSDHITVKFMSADGKMVETKVGHWCKVCKEDQVFVVKHGKWKAFHLGSNSSCRQHIHSHYELYQKQCKELKIVENPHAVPRELVNVWEAAKNNTRRGQQATLDGQFPVVPGT
ncbi:hypothetical protein PAXRUDRAFT_152944, partial [Paxillus rubicundulus Ve08.2h10]